MPPTITQFTPGDIVVSVYGNGDGSGPYTDNQATPITLEELTPAGTVVGIFVLPTTTRMVNGVTEYAISGEYGSSSEGSLSLSADGHSLVIAGYGVNPVTYNAGGAAVYGNAAEAQSTSVPGGKYTAVPRVVADIAADGTVDTSTALYNVFNTNNPRSVATVDGSSFYLAGQGVKGDTTQGVFLARDGASSATAINTADDARIVEIANGQLFVSQDSKQPSNGGTANVASVGTGLPSAASAETPLPGISQTVALAGNGNTINGGTGTVHLSPEAFFFANATTLYVADSGNPKQGGLGDGGLQKWTLSGGTWSLAYTLSAGLGLVANTASGGTTGLIGLTGQVVGNSVQLYATNATIGDLDQTALYGITDSLASTTGAGESFTTLLSAASGTNIRGVAFAPSVACFHRGTLILTPEGERPVESLAIGNLVVTVSGQHAPIVWLGQRSYAGRLLAGRPEVLPVRFSAGSLGDGMPVRDLVVSPKHAMLLDGVLVPAGLLVNGDTIRRVEDLECVHYHHVELARHDAIWAEGAASETFVDDDGRAMFHNAADYAARYGELPSPDPVYCARRVESGFELEAVRRRLDRRRAA